MTLYSPIKRYTKIGILICFLSALSCSEDSENNIDGSLAKTIEMDFDFVRARLYESEIAVEYIQNNDQGEMAVLRLTVKTSVGPIQSGTKYDLLTQGAVDRHGDFSTHLPPLESGTIEFDSYSNNNGAEITGSFNTVFQGDNGSTLTLFGDFSTDLEVVNL